jgi:hypothetical protein
MMSMCLVGLFFHSRNLAHVARCNSIWSRPWVLEVSLYVRLSVPHDCWLLALIFKIARSDNVYGRCSLVGP